MDRLKEIERLQVEILKLRNKHAAVMLSLDTDQSIIDSGPEYAPVYASDFSA